jgi:hypothetical protein
MIRTLAVSISCVVAVSACAPHYEQSLEIVEALELAEHCTRTDTPRERGLFDIGTLDASQYWIPARFAFEARRDGEPFDGEALVFRSLTFFSSDDAPLQLATTPLNADTARKTAASTAAALSGELTDIAFVNVVIPEDATSLAREPAIAAALRSPSERVRVDVHVAVEANVSPYVPPAGAPNVVSPFFTFPLDLCAGCLVPRCAEGETLQYGGACFLGMDVPSTCEPLE